MLNNQSQWAISNEEFSLHRVQFDNLNPNNGYINGTQAKEYFTKSKLPNNILGKIWSLADYNQDGLMTLHEFSIAMHLIKKKLEGSELPLSLPKEMLASPNFPFQDARNNNVETPGRIVPSYSDVMAKDSVERASVREKPSLLPERASIREKAVSSSDRASIREKVVMSSDRASMREKSGMFPDSYPMPPLPKRASPNADWTIMQTVRPRYRLQFNQQDRQKKGYLNGDEAKAVLLQSGLSNTILAQIWNLSDVDCDGKLTCEEFCVAMYLVEQARAGRSLPSRLPDSLVPPSMLTPVSSKTPPVNPSSPDISHINEVQSEGASAHKVKDFDFKPMVNQKFEKEKKRLIDMEHARLQQAVEERNMEKELLKKMKDRKEYLIDALAVEEEKCQQFQVKLKESMESLENHKAEIECMRFERDKLVDTTACLHEELEAAKAEHSRCQKDKTSLQQKFNIELNNHSFEDNITQIEQQKQIRLQSISSLQQEIIDLQNNIDHKNQAASTSNNKLQELEVAVNQQRLTEILRLKYDVGIKRNEVMEILEKHRQFSSLDPSLEEVHEVQNESLRETMKVQRYEALYNFTGRQSDELTFKKNDVIMVQINPPDSTAPGWMCGRLEYSDFFGVFPELYVKKMEDIETETLVTSLELEIDKEQNMFDRTLPQGSTIKKAPSNIWVEAIFPWMMDVGDSAEGQLSFKVGQRIRVLEEFSDDWWKGEMRSFSDDDGEMYNVGWFPRIYVQPVSYVDSDNIPRGCMVESTTKYSNLNFSASNDINGAPTSPNACSTHSSGSGEYCLALYPYESSVPGDLTMRPGDIIRLIDTSEDWWKGHIRGIRQTGLFPSHYVKKLTKQELDNPATLNTLSSQYYTSLNPDHDHLSTMTYDDIDRSTVNNVTPSNEKDGANDHISDQLVDPASYSNYCTLLDTSEDNQNDGPSSTSLMRGIVVTSYFASNEDELTCAPGQIVTVTDKSLPEWYKIEISVNDSIKIGWVPRHCISVNVQVEDNAVNELENSDPMTASGYDQCLTMAFPDPSDRSSICEEGFKAGDRLISMYPYSAQNPDELTFDKNCVIQLLSKDEPEWWRGRNILTSMVGLFPVNYVRRPQTNCPADEELIQESIHIPSDELNNAYSNVTGRPISWYIDGNVKFNAILTEDEKRRQFYILELIETEKMYYEDLQEVHTVFYDPIKKTNMLTALELKHIFINWTELIPKSYNFYMALKIRRDNGGVKQPIQCIGDILLSNFPNFIIYVRFCSLQNQAISLLEKRKQAIPKFKEFCHQCEENLRCKKMPMTSYFLKPMQRITKYKLLVENILKYTEENHPDRGDMEEAVAAARSLCEAVNEGIKEKENAERLEWIQDHVNCDGLNDKLYFNSTTNSLGHRKLIYSGSLCKAKSGKELVGFLFNDFLLLSTPNYNTNGCPFVFPLETSSSSKMQFKMYKKPILLNRILIMTGIPSTQNSMSVTASTNVFNSSSNNEIFTIKDAGVDHVLKALSVNDRDKWVERLVAASLQYIEIENTVREISMSIRRSAGVGRLIVTVLEAINLKSCGVSENKTNSYCEASLGNQLRRSKVISSTYNPKWNCHMQFLIKNIELDMLCVAVYDKEYFAPNDFLGRTEIALKEIKVEKQKRNGPVEKRLKLMGVNSGELILRLDLALFRNE